MQPEAPSPQVIALGFAVLVTLGGLFMRQAAKYIKIQASLGKCLAVALINLLANFVIFALLGLVGAGFAGFFIGTAANVVIIRAMFKAEWGQSFVIWLGYLFASILSMFAMQAL
jgi:hypothetical protein